MSIQDWPDNERPREKLLSHGSSFLSDAELLAILLRTGTKGKTALDLSRALLKQYGGLRQVLTMQVQEFCSHPGLGKAKYAFLQTVLEVNRRQHREIFERNLTLNDPGASRDFLLAELRDSPQEIFACIFLDAKHRVLKFEKLFYGTINGASVHPREILKKCLHHNASALILAHNHPSGVPEPSAADIQLTKRLVTILKHIDVSVLDHLVIGDGTCVSFADRGLI